ncbi:hypothetical protein HMPREF1092_02590 [Clostridium thermobutyricum]|uniref:Transporter n=1 Tax=Clostridium thermobutyricum TaxID=29372 RepID=N9XWX2_9CLOT|nr:hypothetical protein [Clostridium thermobutyricum]ENZ00424.1 hypothetical protein HMPREF1092_02590 [Clostridium thermobutyricum]
MLKYFSKIFQIAAVFIGTIVGAGLASGQEITHFFTSFGPLSFIFIVLCGIFYIIITSIIIKISSHKNLNSYSDFINVISPNFFGKITGVTMTFYLISSASIILAGSGALIHQFSGIPKIVGTFLMIAIAIFFLYRGTEGLIEINSFIVPTLIFTIVTITGLYLFLCMDTIDFTQILGSFAKKEGNLAISTILYAGYNVFCCCGVLVPLCTSVKNNKIMKKGVIVGAVGLTLLSLMINFLLTVNVPYIFEYEVPLLFVSKRFGTIIQALLLIVILMEMFSTEVSDVYSISRTLEHTFKIPFKKSVILVLLIAFPISLIGFGKLISTLYPIFGMLSLIFVFCCVKYYIKNKNNLK